MKEAGWLISAIRPLMFGQTRVYCAKTNETFIDRHGFVLRVHRKKPYLKPMPRYIQKSNAGKFVIRSRFAHVFADQKSRTGLFIRTVGLTRATMRIGLGQYRLQHAPLPLPGAMDLSHVGLHTKRKAALPTRQSRNSTISNQPRQNHSESPLINGSSIPPGLKNAPARRTDA